MPTNLEHLLSRCKFFIYFTYKKIIFSILHFIFINFIFINFYINLSISYIYSIKCSLFLQFFIILCPSLSQTKSHSPMITPHPFNRKPSHDDRPHDLTGFDDRPHGAAREIIIFLSLSLSHYTFWSNTTLSLYFGTFVEHIEGTLRRESREGDRTMSLRPSSRTEVRKKSYKSGVDGDEARRRREYNLVEIWKSKREDSLLKKRREGILLLQSQQSNERGTPSASAYVIQQKVFTFFFELFFLHSVRWGEVRVRATRMEARGRERERKKPSEQQWDERKRADLREKQRGERNKY